MRDPLLPHPHPPPSNCSSAPGLHLSTDASTLAPTRILDFILILSSFSPSTSSPVFFGCVTNHPKFSDYKTNKPSGLKQQCIDTVISYGSVG